MNHFKTKEKSRLQDIMKKLEEYPHSFQMKDMKKVQKSALEGLRNHLKAGLAAGYCTSLETARTRNLLAYALFQLRERHEAIKQTDEVLAMEDQQDNIVSLANKTHMLGQMTNYDEAEEIISQLRQLKEHPDFDYLVVKAKAELAASYMRFGPRFNQFAADTFKKEVIPQAREPEACMWKFGLAVTYRQSLDLQHAPYKCDKCDTITHNDAMILLQEIIDCKVHSEGEGASDNLKANAHAEMALLLHSVLDPESKNRLCFTVHTGPLASCKKALALDSNDPSVLWKTGKIFRHYRDLFRSRKLLQKSIELQPSSAAYHHLGLTYKAMATNSHYGTLKTRRGGKRVKQRKLAKEEKLKQLNGRNEVAAAAAAASPAIVGAVAGRAGRPQKPYDRAAKIKKAIKSPKNSTSFDSDDHNVKAALENLKLAIDFSENENSRALYDLALMHKAMNEYPDALKLFQEISLRHNDEICTPSGLLEQIAALEQEGLIYKEFLKVEKDELKQTKWKKKIEDTFLKALTRAADLYSTTADVRNIFGKVFHSPSALLKAAEASDHSEWKKQKIKAQIFSLISHHKEASAALRVMPDEERDAEYYQLLIEDYLKAGDPDKAVACFALLRTTEMHDEVVKKLGLQTVHSGFLQAGAKALQEGIRGSGFFTAAFRHYSGLAWKSKQERELFAASDLSISSDNPAGAQTMTRNSASSHYDYDVMLLHDEEDDDIEKKAEKLAEILQKACQLSVVRRNEDGLPGTNDHFTITENMEKSCLVVILPGKKEMMREFQAFLGDSTTLRNKVVLLMDAWAENTLPAELKRLSCPLLPCPAKLLDVIPAGPYNKESINAICQLLQYFARFD